MTRPRVVAAPTSYIPIRRPSQVWITDDSGRTVVVERPRVLSDSLYGRTRGGEEVWIPLDGSVTIRARQLDKTKTYLTVAGIVGGITLTAALMSNTGESVDIPNEDSLVPARPRRSLFNITVLRF